MEIAYDFQVFAEQGYGGASRYFWEIARHIAQMPETHVRILAFAHFNEYIRHSNSEIVRGRYVPIVPKTRILREAVNEALTRAWFTRHSVQVVHETNYRPKSWASGYKSVITVHDMVHEKFPEYFRKDDRTGIKKAAAVRRADHVICISESTRRDLIERIELDPAKVSVIYHGFSDLPLLAEKRSPQAPYILYVGPRAGYKNFARLLEAYGRSKRLRQDFVLICFGSFSFSTEERQRIQELGIPDERVTHRTGGDAQLADLYRNASLFVYPSLYEGFGIPPLEAMSLNCPVACSNTSSLPEVVGDAAQTFDPAQIESIQEAMEQALYSAGRSDFLRAQGQQRAARFSWRKCAAETYSVYQALP